ncbi:MAG: single-stranded-DNA-specific exonuclease RecJ [Tannerella sp.]|jgi:single-stranded-DNA-specific exonuclease|nr:single-stranded-DNA-specific exonuclease RecJ [Tannerella sp.]
MTRQWNLKNHTKEEDKRLQEMLDEGLRLNPVVGRMLVKRGITTFDGVKKYFRPNLNDLHDPFLLPDMHKAVSRLNKALGNNEKILIYGDYDVDGTSAVALVYRFLRPYSTILDYYIPDRYDEGYGVSYRSIDYAEKNGITLVIALDCGIKAIDKIAYANKKGIDFIICDHHTPDDVLPDALAVIDAKRTDSTYPYEHLSGCGVGFKFMQAFAQSNDIPFTKLECLLELTAISIASDIVPITGENRILAYYGLRQLNFNPSIGMKGIIKTSGLTDKDITISDIVYKIGPRINASGRMTNGREAVDLMLARDEKIAGEKAADIDLYNEERKEMDRKITDEANAIIDMVHDIEDQKGIVVYNQEWHKGVIGIVASRLTEKYYRPAVVLTKSADLITGSARSIQGFDIYNAIESCRDLLENFGGHTYAAGLSLREENLEAFTERFMKIASEEITPQQMIPQIDIDDVITLRDVNDALLKDLKRMNPFGPDNEKPVFCAYQVRDFGTSRLVGKDGTHLKLELKDNTTVAPTHAIAFGMGEHEQYVKTGNPVDICFTVEENDYNNIKSIQLMIKDIRPSK